LISFFEQELYNYNKWRSNAQDLVNQVPVIKVSGNTALCDGGGGATGHPIEYIQLNKRNGLEPAICKYCGLKFVSDGHHHH
jgi:NADH dehydrogenase (ubiquinone) Fe-S protein 6